MHPIALLSLGGSARSLLILVALWSSPVWAQESTPPPGRRGPPIKRLYRCRNCRMETRDPRKAERFCIGVPKRPGGRPSDPMHSWEWIKPGRAPKPDPTLIAEGMTYYQAGDYSRAVALFRRSAESGDPDGLFNLGVMYRDGTGVQQNHRESLRLYEKAAEQDHAKSIHNIGNLYETGRGVPQDYVMAFQYFHRAAQLGNPKSMTQVGHYYETGKGTRRDDRKAYEWTVLAAENGDPHGIFGLGRYYETGKMVPVNWCYAIYLFHYAADLGLQEAKDRLAALRNPEPCDWE